MKAFLIGGAIAALAAGIAIAQPAPPPPPGVAQGTAPAPMAPPPPRARQEMRVEFRSDHAMTRDEVAKHVAEMFARFDTNHDGFITKEEIQALQAQMEAKIHAAMERAGEAETSVGDIQHQLAERGVFIGDRGAMFDRLDANHDGVISRQEFMARPPEMRTENVMILRGPGGAPGAPGMPPMDGHPMRMEMHHMGGMGMGMGGFGMRLFEMADADHDGRVSLAEAQAAALAHFDKADLNHDGKISPEERAQTHAEMREHHPI